MLDRLKLDFTMVYGRVQHSSILTTNRDVVTLLHCNPNLAMALCHLPTIRCPRLLLDANSLKSPSIFAYQNNDLPCINVREGFELRRGFVTEK
jgi:hypothetical protein